MDGPTVTLQPVRAALIPLNSKSRREERLPQQQQQQQQQQYSAMMPLAQQAPSSSSPSSSSNYRQQQQTYQQSIFTFEHETLSKINDPLLQGTGATLLSPTDFFDNNNNNNNNDALVTNTTASRTMTPSISASNTTSHTNSQKHTSSGSGAHDFLIPSDLGLTTDASSRAQLKTQMMAQALRSACSTFSSAMSNAPDSACSVSTPISTPTTTTTAPHNSTTTSTNLFAQHFSADDVSFLDMDASAFDETHTLFSLQPPPKFAKQMNQPSCQSKPQQHEQLEASLRQQVRGQDQQQQQQQEQQQQQSAQQSQRRQLSGQATGNLLNTNSSKAFGMLSQAEVDAMSWEISQGAPNSPSTDNLLMRPMKHLPVPLPPEAMNDEEDLDMVDPMTQDFGSFFSQLTQDTSDPLVASLNPGTTDIGKFQSEFRLSCIPSIDDAVLHSLDSNGSDPWDSCLPDYSRDLPALDDPRSSYGGNGFGPCATSPSSCVSFDSVSSGVSRSVSYTSVSDESAGEHGNGHISRRHHRRHKSRRTKEIIRATRRVANMSPEKREHVRRLARDAARRRRRDERLKDLEREKMCDDLLKYNESLRREKDELEVQMNTLVQLALQRFSHLVR